MVSLAAATQEPSGSTQPALCAPLEHSSTALLAPLEPMGGNVQAPTLSSMEKAVSASPATGH